MSESVWHEPVDVSVPSAARMYDWLLGGRNNFPSDRAACEQLLEIAPSTKELALNNRAFLRRVVREIAQRYGIRQFIDHGSGLPVQDNVHQVAQAVAPESRVVYVDNDPIVLSYGRALLDENPNVAIVGADMTDTGAVHGDGRVRELIDFTEPVAALFVSVLHCVPDKADPAGMIRRTVERLAPGSVVVICQLVSERAEIRDAVTRLMEEQTGGRWGRVRTQEEVRGYFEGLRIEEPGLLDVTDWLPDRDPRFVRRQLTDEWIEYGGLALVP
ncbi:SAM-dependent methyltransferase [Kitasatospora sp. NA04385]|uniref:SAM-dependent methyltransferase n=1 Tax=Kitasatospora sp. NA04385 TaxID=2742135 RepID=UPI001590C17B|nr:SAM-dependent methyltransferase [Kitasatospora sp. NA04385]QKW19600.1 SAM-dependent methyltransferase [Kitasatospora sp. NA04385]